MELKPDTEMACIRFCRSASQLGNSRYVGIAFLWLMLIGLMNLAFLFLPPRAEQPPPNEILLLMNAVGILLIAFEGPRLWRTRQPEFVLASEYFSVTYAGGITHRHAWHDLVDIDQLQSKESTGLLFRNSRAIKLSFGPLRPLRMNELEVFEEFLGTLFDFEAFSRTSARLHKRLGIGLNLLLLIWVVGMLVSLKYYREFILSWMSKDSFVIVTSLLLGGVCILLFGYTVRARRACLRRLMSASH